MPHLDQPLCYNLPEELGVLIVEPQVVHYLLERRQKGFWSKEAGGQLFGIYSENEMRIVEATGPRPTDRCGMYHYWPDRESEKAEIKDRHRKGLHFLGDWHTHKQRHPCPSSTDIESVQEMVIKSTHHLPGFLMLIVGNEKPPLGFHVSFHTVLDWVELRSTSYQGAKRRKRVIIA